MTDYEVEYPDEFEDYEDAEDYYSCDNCGPWCPHWGGDGLCELEIEAFAKEHEDFEKKYKSQRLCPVCNESLECWQIPDVDTLWQWSAQHHPLIGLEIYRAYGVPKGVVHSKGNIYHVWIGEGEYREEKLIQPLGKQEVQNGSRSEVLE